MEEAEEIGIICAHTVFFSCVRECLRLANTIVVAAELWGDDLVAVTLRSGDIDIYFGTHAWHPMESSQLSLWDLSFHPVDGMAVLACHADAPERIRDLGSAREFAQAVLVAWDNARWYSHPVNCIF